jgi:DNA repair exonuclease SbcCD nuclease subunit
LRNKGYDYWALGHVHQYEVLAHDPPIVFPGNIQGRHIRETGPKGCVVVAVDEAGRTEMEFTPVDVIRWDAAEVDAAGAQNAYEVVDHTRTRLETLLEAHDGMALAVRVLVRGETAACSELLADPERWATEIRAAANEAGNGRIWVEKIRIDTRPSTAGRTLPKTGAVAELLDLFEELAADADARREVVAELSDLDKKLPREIKDGADGLDFENPQWSADLLARVKPMLIRRLLHKEGDR